MDREQVEYALKKFADHLPAHLRNTALTNTSASMQYLIGVAQLFLYDTDLPIDENAEALVVVRRLIRIMRLGDRNDWGDEGLVVIMVWNCMGRLLIREGLRIEVLGWDGGLSVVRAHADSVSAVDAEIEFVKEALRRRGRNIRLA